ncbi:divergent PAP2 family protein [Alicyclobacillus fastidiosus]|uniref:Divergent PAP2 family protein n=1 Tax=Alicyclobacillus fastidiosus TaxID=392011 RepID=A0ABV5AID4_9BACL|nr:divergent PAP2 family protein [Alicyclobacillus fastidiosus]WEH11153.1 divergent PAP2 family protein [Alicyclobacillus fastidiosus]
MIHPSSYMWVAPLVAMIVAQGLKPFYRMARLRTWDWRQMKNSGGMPSSHSAAVTALVVELWLRYGGSDPILAIGAFVAGVVMYDAAGVRWQTGRQAAVLNRLLHDLRGQSHHVMDDAQTAESADVNTGALQGIRPLHVVKSPWWLIDWPVLDEHVGHKPTEVVGGILVGIIVALIIH